MHLRRDVGDVLASLCADLILECVKNVRCKGTIRKSIRAKGTEMTRAQRAKAGVDAKHFQAALAAKGGALNATSTA
jgi:hypothetical protein